MASCGRAALCAAITLAAAACSSEPPAEPQPDSLTRADSIRLGLIGTHLTADPAWAGEDAYDFNGNKLPDSD